MDKISRRTLARLATAAAASSLKAQQPRAAEYSGPLTGLDEKARGRGLDPLPEALKMVDAAPRRLRFSARNKAQAAKWQTQLRAKLTELLGGFPTERVPLQPATLEARDFPRYRREKIVFDSREGVSVLAYILTPAGARKPIPTMVC